MSQNRDNFVLPFLTRDMLSFEHGTAFSLRIASIASVAATLTIRGITREGTFTLKHVTVADYAIHTQDFRIPDVPILVSVAEDSTIAHQGQCVATLSLIANGEKLYDLCQGFVYEGKALSYPPNGAIDLHPGGGHIRVIAGTNQAAGAEISDTVPSGVRWRLISANFQLVAAAAAASRRVHFEIADAYGGVLSWFSNTNQIISETKKYVCSALGTVQAETDNNFIQIAIPANIYLNTDDTIRTTTTALQGADNFDIPYYTVEEFFRPV